MSSSIQITLTSRRYPLGGRLARSPSLASAGAGLVGFWLFMAVNATLFVRPGDIIPGFVGDRIYLVLIVICLLVSFPSVLVQLNSWAMRRQPISLCILGLLVTAIVSHLGHANLVGAAMSGFEFLKVVIYYLLLVGLVNSPRRLRQFLFCICIFSLLLVVIAILQYHGAISLPNLSSIKDHQFDPETGREVFFPRLRSTGAFGDPNDLSLIIVFCMALSLYWSGYQPLGLARFAWLVAVGLFGYGLSLTHSRGGFLALLIGAIALIRARFGWTKTVLVGALVLPALFVLFAGRQTSLSTSETTGRLRLQLWSDGLMYFKQNPVFGIGYDKYADEVGQVAHNSFLHCFTDLGIFGGMLFLGAFYYGLSTLHRLGRWPGFIPDPELRRLRPYLLGGVAAYAGGLLSLSNSYVVPTYLVLGLTTGFFQVVDAYHPAPPNRLTARFAGHVLIASLVFLALIYLFVRLFNH